MINPTSNPRFSTQPEALLKISEALSYVQVYLHAFLFSVENNHVCYITFKFPFQRHKYPLQSIHFSFPVGLFSDNQKNKVLTSQFGGSMFKSIVSGSMNEYQGFGGLGKLHVLLEGPHSHEIIRA